MLRTSLRSDDRVGLWCADGFLSSNAQDFIEDKIPLAWIDVQWGFLSSNAQDFIEEQYDGQRLVGECLFLSSNAQDFIEEPA